jgi:hypothetical protein
VGLAWPPRRLPRGCSLEIWIAIRCEFNRRRNNPPVGAVSSSCRRSCLLFLLCSSVVSLDLDLPPPPLPSLLADGNICANNQPCTLGSIERMGDSHLFPSSSPTPRTFQAHHHPSSFFLQQRQKGWKRSGSQKWLAGWEAESYSQLGSWGWGSEGKENDLSRGRAATERSRSVVVATDPALAQHQHREGHQQQRKTLRPARQSAAAFRGRAR